MPNPYDATDEEWRAWKSRQYHRPNVGRVLRREVFALHGDLCKYCGGPAEVVDHVVPVTRGGQSVIENLVPACVRCNSSKSAYLVDEWTRRP
jgi:5-methylcytosine-specific restriction endonuclease McrA